eukprot:Polyplicarium_translucidae@DN3403_c0_g1_i1.p1
MEYGVGSRSERDAACQKSAFVRQKNRNKAPPRATNPITLRHVAMTSCTRVCCWDITARIRDSGLQISHPFSRINMTRELMKRLAELHFAEELAQSKDQRAEKLEEITDRLMKEHGTIEKARDHFRSKLTKNMSL